MTPEQHQFLEERIEAVLAFTKEALDWMERADDLWVPTSYGSTWEEAKAFRAFLRAHGRRPSLTVKEEQDETRRGKKTDEALARFSDGFKRKSP